MKKDREPWLISSVMFYYLALLVPGSNDIKYAIYLVPCHPFGHKHPHGILLQISGDLSSGEPLTCDRSHPDTNLMSGENWVYGQGIGSVPHEFTERVVKECRNITLATEQGGGPVQLPDQPARNSLEWINMATDRVVEFKFFTLLVHPGGAIARRFLHINRAEADFQGLPMWPGEQAAKEDDAVPVPVVVYGQGGGVPVPVMAPGQGGEVQVTVVVPRNLG